MTKAELEDAPGFIFSTALLPPICTAATAAIRHLKGISVSVAATVTCRKVEIGSDFSRAADHAAQYPTSSR
jgi:7-keto-8-aminopelargonate synthetase-like enzyme